MSSYDGSLTHSVTSTTPVYHVRYAKSDCRIQGSEYIDGKYNDIINPFGDYCIPIALRIQCVDVSAPVPITSISIAVEGGRPFMTIPFSVFEALSTLTIVDDIKVYSFNFELFMKWLPLIKLRGPALLFMVAAVTDNSNIRRLNFVYKYKLLPNEEHNHVSRAEHRIHHFSIRFIQSVKFTNPLGLDEFGMDITNLVGYCMGYILEGPIDMLRSISCHLNGVCRYDYSHDIFHLTTKRISPTLLYIPYNPDVDPFTTPVSDIMPVSEIRSEGGVNHLSMFTALLRVKATAACEFTVHNLAESHIDMGSNTILWTPNIEFAVERVAIGYSESASQAQPDTVDSNDYVEMRRLGGTPYLTGIIPHTNLFQLTEPGAGDLRAIAESIAEATTTPETWTEENRPINPERPTCSIEQADIGAGERYCTCLACENNFFATALQSYFAFQARSGSQKRCPMCRGPWTNWIIYTNSAAETRV